LRKIRTGRQDFLFRKTGHFRLNGKLSDDTFLARASGKKLIFLKISHRVFTLNKFASL
jgi:hypothetical protein